MNTDDAKTIGQRIRDARNSAGFKSAARAAREFGYAVASYTAWEGGTRLPRHQTLVELAEKLNVNVTWLMTGETDMAVTGDTILNGGFRLLEVEGLVGQEGFVSRIAMPKVEPRTVAPARIKPGFETFPLHCWQLVGDDVAKTLPNALYVSGVLYEDLEREPRHGEIVILHRTFHGTHHDWIVRVCSRTSKGFWYLSESRDPDKGAIAALGNDGELVHTPHALIIGAFQDLKVTP